MPAASFPVREMDCTLASPLGGVGRMVLQVRGSVYAADVLDWLCHHVVGRDLGISFSLYSREPNFSTRRFAPVSTSPQAALNHRPAFVLSPVV